VSLLEILLQQRVVLKKLCKNRSQLICLAVSGNQIWFWMKSRFFLKMFKKNNFIINTILEIQTSFDIILIQEPLWSFIWSIPSLNSKEREELVRVSNHLNWIIFARNSSNYNDSPRVITYINIKISSLCFLL